MASSHFCAFVFVSFLAVASRGSGAEPAAPDAGLAAWRERARVATDADQGRVLLQDQGEVWLRALRLHGDRTAGAQLRAAVEGVLDSWEIRAGLAGDDGKKRKAPASRGVAAFESDFFLWPTLLDSFRGLQEAGLADAALRARVRRWAEATVQPQERGPNNRAVNFGAGAALAATLFPDSPHAAEWTRYAEAVWSDWWTPGDTYEPAYTRHLLPHLFQLGELLGKTAELTSERARLTYNRYRDEISPGGLAVQPGDGEPYSQSDYVPVLREAARLTGDGTYLWAAERAVLAGRGASLAATSLTGAKANAMDGPVPPAQQAAALEREFGELYAAGLKPIAPAVTTQVLQMFPATHARPDRILLTPARAPGNPYAAFFVFDDTNYLFHGGVGDQRGQLYHYEVNGTLLLYHFGRYEWPGWANTLVVARADEPFPFRQTEGVYADRWYHGSGNLRGLHHFMPTADYTRLNKVDTGPQAGSYVGGFLDRSQPLGYRWGNPDGLAGKNDTVSFDQVTLRFALFPRDGEKRAKVLPGRSWWGGYETRNVAPADGPVDVLIKDLRLEGAAGVKTLVAFDALPPGTAFAFYPPKAPGDPDFRREPLAGSAAADVAQIVVDPDTGRKALRVHTRFGRTELVITGLHQTVELTRDYNRVGLDYRYVTPIDHWVRAPIELLIDEQRVHGSLMLDGQQGGILESARAEQQGRDSFGRVSYRGIWTHDSRWRRRSVLTGEGILVVIDDFYPGAAADGLTGGPVWQLLAPPEAGGGDSRQRAWYDATGATRDTRSTSTKFGGPETALLVAFAPVSGAETGVQPQPKQWDQMSWSTYQRATFKAGERRTFVSVLLPHAKALPAAAITAANGVRVETAPDGGVQVWLAGRVPGWGWRAMELKCAADETWSVKRSSDER